MPIPTKAARRIPATGRQEVYLIKAAGKKPLMAVYDERGVLQGLVDPDKVQPIASPGGKASTQPSNAEVAAQAAKVKANLDASRQQAAAEEVQKAVAGILHAQPERRPAPAGSVIKKAANVDEQFEQLCKAVGPSKAGAIRGAVSSEAIKLVISGAAADSNRAIAITKRAACQLAVNRKWI